MRIRFKSFTWSSETGGGLVEALVSTGITAFGVLAVSTLFLYGTRLQTVAKDGASAMSLATARLEKLRMLPANDPQRAIGGTITGTPQSNYNETIGNYRVMWKVSAGPASTLDVQVLVKPVSGLARPAQIEGLLWQ